MKALLRQMFDAAVASAQPSRVIASHLPAAPAGRLIVIAAGKASAAMAQAVEQHWPGALEGLVVTRYGYAVPCERPQTCRFASGPPRGMRKLGAARRFLMSASRLSKRRTRCPTPPAWPPPSACCRGCRA